MTHFRILVALAVAVLSVAAASASAQTSDPPEKLVEVAVSVIAIDVERVDDVGQTFQANIVVFASWRDHRLAHDGPAKLGRDLDEIWNPRLQIVNLQRMLNTMTTVEIAPDGSVLYRQRGWGTFTQPLKLHDFPLDRQTFEIRLVAMGFHTDEVKFVPNHDFPSSVGSELSLADWTILNSGLEITPYVPVEGIEPLTSAALRFEATRKLGYYRWKILLPLVLIVAMSWIVFWIDPEMSGPQISVAVTSMLTLIAYRFMIAGLVPKVSYLTRLDLFILLATVLVFLTLVESALTAITVKRGRTGIALRIDRWCRWVFPVTFFLVCVLAFFA